MANGIIAIASDHAGFALKEELIKYVETIGYDATNLGTDSTASVDYPDYGHKAADSVAQGEADYGIIICGSGIGISIAANRNHRVRAALCQSAEEAKLAREHNNANILALGARLVDIDTAKECVDVFLRTDFAGGRHEARVEKLG